MKRISNIVILALTGAAAFSSPAAAEDLGAGFAVGGGTTLVSDYRFRGISQSNKRFALQGTLTLSHTSGFYGTIWSSSIDDYVSYGADTEIDLIGGYRKTFGGTTVDAGVLYYVYPGSATPYSDFFEPYVSLAQAFGPVTAKVTANYAPAQKALSVGFGKEDSLYVAGDLSGAIPKTPVSLTAHLGHSYGPSYLTIGKGYTDWSVGAAATFGHLTAGIAYVDTNKAYYTPLGRNVANGGVVASIGASF